jgi:hypothetical protein
MSDAQTEDARPLTKEERDMLISCLFQMSSAIYDLSKSHHDALAQLGSEHNIKIHTPKNGDAFLSSMKNAMDTLYKLGEKFGVLNNE